eukprot:gb/GECH01004164.1/.p1 GENE.gb/GECH01004164.1/~~gb/GECH01004164.1/.p1  ORF type:complete len:626 (+),score=145.46 gb/GECH01004164.1/:1-1878(+)
MTSPEWSFDLSNDINRALPSDTQVSPSLRGLSEFGTDRYYRYQYDNGIDATQDDYEPTAGIDDESILEHSVWDKDILEDDQYTSQNYVNFDYDDNSDNDEIQPVPVPSTPPQRPYLEQLVESSSRGTSADGEDADFDENVHNYSRKVDLTKSSERSVYSLPKQISLLSDALSRANKMINQTHAALKDALKDNESLQSILEQVSNEQQNDTSQLQHGLHEQDKKIRMLESEIKRLREENNDYKQQNSQTPEISHLKDLLETAQARFAKEAEQRRKLHNALIEVRGNIRVHCRVRPPLNGNKKTDNIMQIDSYEDSVAVEVGKNATGKGKCRRFNFDKVYPMDATQRNVFEDVRPLISSVLDGYNVCILAYGQTGSGKTYTMQGLPDNPGIAPQAIRELFQMMKSRQDVMDYRIRVCVCEIYNNTVRDLLVDPRRASSSRYEVYESQDGVEVPNLRVIDVTNPDHVLRILERGLQHRAETSTLMNEHSSRSHSIVTLEVQGKPKEGAPPGVHGSRAKLRLVDLAGSENVIKSGVNGDAMRETSFVNRSLSALGDVLTSLSQNKQHIPYRNAVLTHMLKDSLGGDAKMLLFVNISPEHTNTTESLHALSFGFRARQVKRGAAPKHSIK